MGPVMGAWDAWLRCPQQIWLRRALFQIHLWAGIGIGLYIVVVSVTGSVVVYRNELYRLATPTPVIVAVRGPFLTDERLSEAARAAYPGFTVVHLYRPRKVDRPVDIWLEHGAEARKRLFDPYTGADLGNSVAPAITFVSSLVDLHDNLMGGATGRMLNGIGGILTVVLGLTGLVLWWPGVQHWRRGLTLRRRVGWKRFNWDLHSVLGFWTLGFVVLFGATGVYLSFPASFAALADRLEPPTDANAGTRVVDGVMYWFAYLHFGRFGGGTTKALWAAFGLAPVALFVTGTLMWWNRVLSPIAPRPRATLTVSIDRPR